MSPAVATVARTSNRTTVTIAATITARFLLSAFPLGSMLFDVSGETVGVWVREVTSIGTGRAEINRVGGSGDAVLDSPSECTRDDVGIGGVDGVGETAGIGDEVSPAVLVVTIFTREGDTVRGSEELIGLTDELVGRACSVTKNDNKFVNS